MGSCKCLNFITFNQGKVHYLSKMILLMPNGDGTRKGKKPIGLISKTQLCTCIALFYKFLFVVVFHDCKLPSYMFYG